MVRSGWTIKTRSGVLRVNDTLHLLRYYAFLSKEGPVGTLHTHQVPWAMLIRSEFDGETATSISLSSDTKAKLFRDIRALIPVATQGN